MLKSGKEVVKQGKTQQLRQSPELLSSQKARLLDIFSCQSEMACFADHKVSWKIVVATRRSTVCPLYKVHTWPTIRLESDGPLKWKGNSSINHYNSPNWKLDQVVRRFKNGLCLSTHGSLVGFHTRYHSELLLCHRLACCSS